MNAEIVVKTIEQVWWCSDAYIDARSGEVRGAELAEEHLLIPRCGTRARQADGLGHGRHRAAVERVVRVLHTQTQLIPMLSSNQRGREVCMRLAHRRCGGDGEGARDPRVRGRGDGGGGEEGADQRGEGVGLLRGSRERRVDAQRAEEGQRTRLGLRRRQPLILRWRRRRHRFDRSLACCFGTAAALDPRGN